MKVGSWTYRKGRQGRQSDAPGVGLKVLSDSNGFIVGGEIFFKNEFIPKFHMVLKQADQTWMKKVVKISQMSLDISPKVGSQN